MDKIETALRTRWYLRMAVYAAIAAALLLTWLLTDGPGVEFVYSEF